MQQKIEKTMESLAQSRMHAFRNESQGVAPPIWKELPIVLILEKGEKKYLTVQQITAPEELFQINRTM